MMALESVLLPAFLVFTRVMALLIAVPFFGYGNIPFRVLVIVGAGLTVALAPSQIGVTLPDVPYILLVAGEVGAGVLMGFVFGFVIHGARMAGEIVGQEMGFNMASVVDPETGARVPLMGYLYELIIVLIWFGSNGHHVVIRTVARSFETLPPGGDYASIIARPGELLVLFAGFFEAALRLGAPVFAVLLLATVGLGLLAKAVPQFNILDIGFPTRILVGLLATALLLPASLRGFQYVIAFAHHGVASLVEGW